MPQLSQSQQTPTQLGGDVVRLLSSTGTAGNTRSGNTRRMYDRVATHNGIDDNDKDEDEDEDADIEESLQNQETGQTCRDAKYYSNFSIDDDEYDCSNDTVMNSNKNGQQRQRQRQRQHQRQHLVCPMSQHQSLPLSSTPRSPFSKHDGYNYHHCNSQSPVPPQNYICPLTLQLMEFPIHDGCGHTFERRAILQWLEANSDDGRNEPVCPISRKPMLPIDNDDTNTNTNTNTKTTNTNTNTNTNTKPFSHSLDRVLRNDPDLQRRILEWKMNHPMYQGVDAEYAKHQRETMLFHHDRSGDTDEDDRSCCTAGSNSNSNSSEYSYRLSRFELMLLPQERRVLKIVQTRARLRKEHLARSRRVYRCLLASIVVTIIALLVLYAVVKHRALGEDLGEDLGEE